MSILHKISFITLITFLFSCNNQEKLMDTWISDPVNTVFTSWDISKDKIVSNMLSPNKQIAKYKIRGNKIVIDSGVVLLGDFYIPKNETLEFKVVRDRLKIIFPVVDSIIYFDFERNPNLPVYERLLPDKMLDIDLPYVDYAKVVDLEYPDLIFLGFPKDKFLESFKHQIYLQLNDVLTHPGDPVLREFVSVMQTIPTIIFSDKNVKMMALDSVRTNLFNHRILFTTLNDNLEFGCVETFPYYYCNCIPVSNLPPPAPTSKKCKHQLLLEKKSNEILFRIDEAGNYFFQDTLINVSDITKIAGLISERDESDTIIFIQYDDSTSFDDYIALYSVLKQEVSAPVMRMTIIDINEKDLNYLEKFSW